MIPTTRSTLVLAALAVAALAACDQARNSKVSASEASGALCTSCHGDAGRAEADPLLKAAPPIDTAGRATSDAPGVGAHQAHLHGGALRAGVACTECHVVPTSSEHATQPLALAFGPLATGGGATPTFEPATLTCATTYCHGATLGAGGTNHAPRWTGGSSQAACGTCHGAPPPSHAATSTNCNACHPGTVKPDGSIDVAGGLHIDGKVEVTGGHPAGWADPAQHGHAVASQGLTACKTCHGADLAGGTAGVSCTSCHASAGWPDWQANCTFCHGTRVPGYTGASLASAAPPLGTHGETLTTDRAVGAHQRHLTGGLVGQPLACAECHTVPTDLTHVTGTPLVTFGAGARRGNATPSWNGTTCATYCHGATLQAGGSNTAPSWTGGPSQAACGTCHGAPPPSHAATSTSCYACHPGTVKPDGTIDVAGGLHIDGVLEVTSPHPAGWADKTQHGYAANTNLSACAGCHGADFAGGTTGVSCTACHAAAGWAGWQTNCTFCHGTRVAAYTSANLASAAPPVGTQGQALTTDRAVGAHQKHLGGGLIGQALACTDCHAVPTDLTHVNGTATVTFGAAARRGGATPSWNGTTCATYCHGATLQAGGSNTAPSWTGGPSQAACGTCHGAPPPSHAATSTNCNACHPGTVKPDGSIDVAGGLHMNGTVDVTGGHPAGWADKTQHGYTVTAQGLASCKTCHGAALDGGTAGVSCASCHAAAGFPAWNTNCTFCHGNRTTGRASPPVDTQGLSATSTVSVGVHDAHVGTTLTTPIACGQCHPARGDVITDAAHVDGNGQAEVVFGPLATTGGVTPVYTRTSATQASCASTYCHGNFAGGPKATMSWTSTAQVGCTSCHGAPPSTGHHGDHSGRSCGDCHPGYGTTAVNVATHIDGAKEVGNRITSWNPTTRACVGCHGSATW